MNRVAALWKGLGSYGRLGLNILSITAAEILLKTGATSPAVTEAGIFNVHALGSLFTWAGIGFYIAGFVVWLSVLRSMPLSRAYSFSCLVYVTVPLAAWAFLGETISRGRVAGILLVLSGCYLVASDAAIAEERL